MSNEKPIAKITIAPVIVKEALSMYLNEKVFNKDLELFVTTVVADTPYDTDTGYTIELATKKELFYTELKGTNNE